jgi:RNA polymerase sigma-70 factor (ECF subfamily)
MGLRPGTRRPLSAEDRVWLDQLVRTCGPRLLAYVRRTYGSRLDAEEIVAETFSRAAANLARLRKCARHDLYLLTIVRNLCRDFFRRRAASGPEETLEDCPAATPEPDATLTQTERRRALRAGVAALPEAQREVVTLRLSAGLKFEEIAELLNLPLGTVLSRMHAAVQRLKQDLGCVHER